MATIKFVKTDNSYSILDLGTGRTLDSGGEYRPNQTITMSGGGKVQVCDMGEAERYITSDVMALPVAIYNQLVNFLKDDTVRWSGKTFDFRDETYENVGDEIVVRWWGDVLVESPMKSGHINVAIKLRVEI